MSRLRILDGTMLKLLAIVSMVIDHVGSAFFPEAVWMRAVGRLAMPIFAFCIAEGYLHTRNRRRYLLQLGLFALISELPFDLAFFGGLEFTHQNIMLTFFLAVMGLMLYDGIRERFHGRMGIVFGFAVILVIAMIATLLDCDYIFFGVITVFLYYVLSGRPHWVRQLGGTAFIALTRTIGYYAATGFAVIPLLLYNGKRGRGLKWLFYLFYPGHLLVIWLVKCIL